MSEPITHFGYQSIPVSEKTDRVAKVFHSVAKHYDIMNDLMSLGLHRVWKRQAIAAAQIESHHTVLDLAGGTGDLTELIVKSWNQKWDQRCNQAGDQKRDQQLDQKLNRSLDIPWNKTGNICLADINNSMLSQAKERFLDKGIIKNIEYIQANAEHLPFQNNSFHRILIGFGLRNVTDKTKALSEMYRVLKPGGRLVILEFSHPKSAALNRLYDTYSFTLLPLLGKLIVNDKDSYRYLAESIRMHPSQETLKSLMETVLFERVEYQNIHDGIVAIHKGLKF